MEEDWEALAYEDDFERRYADELELLDEMEEGTLDFGVSLNFDSIFDMEDLASTSNDFQMKTFTLTILMHLLTLIVVVFLVGWRSFEP